MHIVDTSRRPCLDAVGIRFIESLIKCGSLYEALTRDLTQEKVARTYPGVEGVIERFTRYCLHRKFSESASKNEHAN